MKRENNFDIIRLLLAYTVVFVHVDDLSGASALAGPLRFFSGKVAVEGFFAISGFLIFASYERSKSLLDYSVKRAARILPGYWGATVFCLTIAFSHGIFHVGPWLAANLTFANFLCPDIAGVFNNTPMDGALWTIKVEVMFYMAVPIIVWVCRRVHRDTVLWSLIVLSIMYHVACGQHEHLAVQLPGALCFFIIGALIHYHLEFFYRYGKWLMPAAAALYGMHLWTGWFVFRPFSTATLTLGAALLLPVVKGPARWGDFSYGTYVLHWPILQLVIAAGVYAAHPWAGLAITLILVAGGSCLSWFVVEKPVLDLAHHHARRWHPAVQRAGAE